MKKLVLLLTITMGLFSFNNAHTDHFNIDIKKSNIKWVGSKITGSSHEGNISISEGNISVNIWQHGKAEFVDMSTISCTDLEGTKAQYLVDHLKNEDFFDVPNHPLAYLKLVKATQNEKVTTSLPH